MGVNICLDILQESIDSGDWNDFFDQARQLLAGYRPALVSLRRERVGDADRGVYSRTLEHDADDPARRSLQVCGGPRSRGAGRGPVSRPRPGER